MYNNCKKLIIYFGISSSTAIFFFYQNVPIIEIIKEIKLFQKKVKIVQKKFT